MLIIRADGNSKIGAGHLMRCLTIADEYQKRNQILFACADELSAQLASQRGYQTLVLGTDYRNMEEELPIWERFFCDKEEKTLFLVDSYNVTEAYLSSLRKYGRVILMDDTCMTAYPVDYLINYNVFASKEAYEKLYQGKGTQFLMGASYIPIRSSFTQESYAVREKLENILLLTGGGDYYGLAEKFVDEFGKKEELKKFTFHLVCGCYQDRMKELQEKAEACGNFYLYENVQDIWKLMAKCDLAITAGGTTVYELCAMGVPFLGYSFADNQQPLLEYLKENQIAPSCGDYREVQGQLMERMAEQIVCCKETAVRKKISNREKELVDGCGAQRIAKILLSWYNERK